MTEEIYAAMDESSWTGTKETARWNGAYSEPLAELDLNRTNEDTNGIVVAGISGSIAQEEAQDDPFDQFVVVAESTPADDEKAESIDEAISGPESPDLDKADISAENLAAIRDAQQPSPKRPKRNSARSGTTYVPTCSPNGTEISNREKAKKSTLETGLPSSSNSSKSKKRKTNTPTSSLADSEGKRKKRTAAVKKINDSSQTCMIDLTDTEEQNRRITVPDNEEEEETVLPAKQIKAVKGRKKKLVADDEAEEEISQTNNPKPSGSGQEVASQNGSKEHQEDESCSKRECDDEMGKEAILKTSKKGKKAESKEAKPTSSNGSSGVVSERSSRTTFEDTTVVEKIESQVLVPRSGKSISSILGTSRFNGARHIGLAKRQSVPSLHLNRREKPKERKSVLIKLETKKKKGQTNDCSDDEDANPFKRREGESEQEFLLRVCDEEGTYDKEKTKSQNRQENEGNEREAEELFPDDNEQEYNYRGEED